MPTLDISIPTNNPISINSHQVLQQIMMFHQLSRCVATLLLFIAWSRHVESFVVAPVRRHLSPLMAQVPLEPEPAGGEEISSNVSVPNTRVKKMNLEPNVQSEDGNIPIYSFWLSSTAEAALIQGYQSQILKDASKKANFPGFRKGQVPPYALPQITQFAVQEGIIKTIQSIVDAYGLISLKGSEGDVSVQEDVVEMAKGWKNQSLQFTATLKAAYQVPIDSSAEAVSTEA
jgi:Bacterial trigger factor protein (TF)